MYDPPSNQRDTLLCVCIACHNLNGGWIGDQQASAMEFKASHNQKIMLTNHLMARHPRLFAVYEGLSHDVVALCLLPSSVTCCFVDVTCAVRPGHARHGVPAGTLVLPRRASLYVSPLARYRRSYLKQLFFTCYLSQPTRNGKTAAKHKPPSTRVFCKFSGTWSVVEAGPKGR
jgi:hypothetical protein